MCNAGKPHRCQSRYIVNFLPCGIMARGVPILLAALLAICQSTSAYCAPNETLETFKAKYIAESRQHFERLQNVQSLLQAKPAADWQDFEIQNYLDAALGTVYCAAIAYKFDRDILPDSFSDSGLSGYIAGWPANPFDSWAPMDVLTLADGFSAGDMVLQLAPPEAWSIVGPLVSTERPMSFELAIYGRDVSFAEFGDPEPSELNWWALTPEGALYMLGTYRESAAVTLAKRAARKQPR